VAPLGAARRWYPVLAYAALSATNQMLWLTYTPFTTHAARHYGVSSGAIGWLAEIFPLVYVVLAVPAGRLIDRNLTVWLGDGAALTALGGMVRLAGDDYLPVLAGQFLVAVAQPLVLNAVTAVSVTYLRADERATGIAVSSAGIFAGMVLALVTGAALGSGALTALLTVQAALAVVAALSLCVALARTGRGVIGPASAASLREVWTDGYLRRLTGLVCVGFGVFVALTTWLQTLLEPAGVSETAAGYLLLAMVVAGVGGSALLPPLIARRGWSLHFVLVSVVLGAVSLAVLAVVPGLGTGLTVSVVLGVLLLTDLPIVLELAERRAGPVGGTASALVWLAGNAAGLVTALLVQALVHHPGAAFVLLAVVLLLGLPLLPALRAGVTDAQPFGGLVSSVTAEGGDERTA
jgi:predicted MFS family arabinose efflux permease